MKKEERSSSTTSWYTCHEHPKEPVVGVCHLCLNDRLLFIIAAKQPHHRVVSNYSHSHINQNMTSSSSKKSQIKFPNNIFRCYSHHDSATPDQDSFISINFKENGVVSWDKGNSVSKVSLNYCNISWNKTTKLETTANNFEGKTVNKNIEKPHGRLMTWRKRVGHMVQLITWKRSSCRCNVRTSNGANGLKNTVTLTKE